MEIENDLKKFSDIEHCPVRNVLSRISSKWAMLILCVLEERSPLRFGTLGRAVCDISPKVLTATLKTLEADGLVLRTVYPEIPPRVEYSLTPLGRSLVAALSPLMMWATDNFSAIMENRRGAGA